MACADRADTLRIVITPTTADVRCALAQARRLIQDWGASDDAASSVEILLAEVLNNILEHALTGRTEGEIAFAMHRDGDLAAVEVIDDGVAMPGLRPPEGTAANEALQNGELPEGGFGWGLIRMLTQDLSYRRESGRNQLSFTVALR